MVLPLAEFRRGAVDVGEIVEGDQILERKLAGHHVVDQLRDELLGHAVALDHAAQAAAVLDPFHLDRNFGAGARAADQHAGARRHQRFERLAQDFRQRGRLQRIAHAGAGELADFSHHIGAAGMIDGVGRADVARHLEPMIVDIDGDDRIAAGDLGRHQARQSDGADAEHHEGVAALRLHHIEHRAGAGLAAAGQGPQHLDRRIVAHLHGIALVGDQIGAER